VEASHESFQRAVPNQLRDFAANIGGNRLLTQGPGGNVSYKNQKELWIKASGTNMKDALKREIFVGLDLAETRANIKEGLENFPIRYGNTESGLRSSIETSMHAQIEAPYVAHVHSVGSVSMSILLDQKLAIRLASDAYKVSFVPYVRPGIGLAKAIREVAEPDTQAVLLGNHGLTVWGDSSEECLEIITNLEKIWSQEFHRTSSNSVCKPGDWTEVLTNGILVPDEVVFLGNNPFEKFSGSENISDFLSKTARKQLENTGWIRDFIEVLEIVAKNVGGYEFIRYLTQSEIAELTDWDAEKYRQGIK
jgi:ribulose-5-phosphate 4-epimerase/fuculose-1-phosphate aldolase